MYFPAADIHVHPLLPPLVAFLISFFTSMGGVSGAFLLLPFQMSVLGFVSPSVSATNQLFNVAAIPGGVYRYVREGRMLWSLAGVIVLGTLPGVLLGAIIRIQYLPESGRFKLFAGAVLLLISGRLLKDVLFRPAAVNVAAEENFHHAVGRRGAALGESAEAVKLRQLNFRHIVYDFQNTSFVVSTPVVMALSFVVGIAGGIYGIGGGSIIAPFLITFLGLPVYSVAGAALMGTFVTSIVGVLFYQFLAPLYPGVGVAPDWALGFLFGVGGFWGMYCGARVQKYAPARLIKWFLALGTAVIGIGYLLVR